MSRMRRMRPQNHGKVPYACARRARTEIEHQFDLKIYIEHVFVEHLFDQRFNERLFG